VRRALLCFLVVLTGVATLGVPSALAATGDTWTTRTSAVDNSWMSVTFGNGLFVAVAKTGTNNRVMTSPDGITWTARVSAADNVWTSVTFGNGLFVAVASSGTNNRVMTSPDGITWTARVSPAGDNDWNSVTFGNGLFVAVASTGTNNRAMTSPDGITWTLRTSAVNNAWSSVTFGNGLFVVVASSGTNNRVMTSAPEPTVSSFTPTFGLAGTKVTIVGTNLTGATAVTFGGIVANAFTINSAVQITATVPTAATTGKIAVTTPGGTATSTYDFTVPTSDRIYGQDAIDTSIAISQAEFPGGSGTSASSVVLARSDFFADALAGGPLAANVSGPLLITPGTPISSALDQRVLAEIQRVLAPGHTVHVLGGPLALSPNIDSTLTNLGYGVERVSGPNQFSTAVAIANQLGKPSAILEATGWNFPDALSAGPAAIKLKGVIVLTNDNKQAPETQAYIDAHATVPRFAIGGPLVAGGADPGATAVYGQDLYGTSAAVATKWFTNASVYGIATGANFPDALSGGVFMASGGRMGPVVLVPQALPLPTPITTYLDSLANGTPGYAFGGPIAISNAVLAAVKATVG